MLHPVDATAPVVTSEPKARTRSGGAGSWAFALMIAAICAFGRHFRHARWLKADNGAGYWLGIVGALMLLALLIYPMRKRIRVIRSWGKVSTWFRVHMALGLLGPALIVVHSNYSLQSLNATVAFLSMLIVAGSGIVGRYLYGRIHKGLYGSKIEARELLAEAARLRASLGDNPGGASHWKARMSEFEKQATAPARSLGDAFGAWMQSGARERAVRGDLETEIEMQLSLEAQRRGWAASSLRQRVKAAQQILDDYFLTLRRAATLAVHERLFSLWHILHLPLFVMLIVAAIIHVVAVHLY